MDTISTEVYVEFGISDVIDIVESADDAQRVELRQFIETTLKFDLLLEFEVDKSVARHHFSS